MLSDCFNRAKAMEARVGWDANGSSEFTECAPEPYGLKGKRQNLLRREWTLINAVGKDRDSDSENLVGLRHQS